MKNWTHVSKENPCCCGKSDWCLISNDGSAYLCMRLEGGKQITLSDGSIGWIHKTASVVPVRAKPETPRPTIDATAIMRKLWRETTDRMRSDLAASLGVTALSLHDIGACWHPAYNAWAFPMRSGTGEIIGIRLRNESGRKWAISGSRQGLFIPIHMAMQLTNTRE